MAKRILARFDTLERSGVLPPMTWAQVESMARALQPKTNLVVPKAVLPDEPPYARSSLGRKRGAERQFRCHRGHQNLHIKEFQGHWVVHVDTWNPHRHALRHLMVDRGFKQFLHVAELALHNVVTATTPSPTPAPA